MKEIFILIKQKKKKLCLFILFVFGAFQIQAQTLVTIQGATTGSPTLYVANGTDVYIQGGINIDQNASSVGAYNDYLQNNGNIYLSNTTLGLTCDFISNVSGLKTYTPGQNTGQVIFGDDDMQGISGATIFMNFSVANTSGIALSDNITIAKKLTLTTGIITTSADTVFIADSSYTSITAGTGNTNYALSWVNGNLNRTFISGSTDTYYFPVGNATKGRLAALKSNALTGVTSFTSLFRPLANGNNSQLNAWETSLAGSPETPYTSINTGGTWVIEPDHSPLSGTYDVSVYFNGFTGMADNQFGILKRPDGSTTYADFKPYGGTLNTTNGLGRKISDGYALRMSLTNFSEFAVGQSNEVLPIELVSFTAEKCDDNLDALLKWNTASEFNNDHFDVEVAIIVNSSGNLTFNKIGEVKGNGTSVVGHDYSFIDTARNKQGTRYYRLNQVDYNGNKTFSEIRALNFDISKLLLNVLYPNPTSDILYYKMVSSDSRNVTISITNIIGQEIFAEQMSIEKGVNVLNFDVSQLSQGTYLLNVKDGGEIRSPQKFEKF